MVVGLAAEYFERLTRLVGHLVIIVKKGWMVLYDPRKEAALSRLT